MISFNYIWTANSKKTVFMFEIKRILNLDQDFGVLDPIYGILKKKFVEEEFGEYVCGVRRKEKSYEINFSRGLDLLVSFGILNFNGCRENFLNFS